VVRESLQRLQASKVTPLLPSDNRSVSPSTDKGKEYDHNILLDSRNPSELSSHDDRSIKPIESHRVKKLRFETDDYYLACVNGS
jgi:hypothetical protein